MCILDPYLPSATSLRDIRTIHTQRTTSSGANSTHQLSRLGSVAGHQLRRVVATTISHLYGCITYSVLNVIHNSLERVWGPRHSAAGPHKCTLHESHAHSRMSVLHTERGHTEQNSKPLSLDSQRSTLNAQRISNARA